MRFYIFLLNCVIIAYERVILGRDIGIQGARRYTYVQELESLYRGSAGKVMRLSRTNGHD